MNNTSKNTRGGLVKETLLEYDNLAATFKQNTADTIHDLMEDLAVKSWSKILNESDDDEKDDDDYEVEEVEDTVSDTDDDAATTTDEPEGEESTDEEPTDGEGEGMEPEGDDDADLDTTDVEADADANAEEGTENEPEGDNDDKWADFAKYQVSKDKYDLSKAEDDEVVTVFKKILSDDDTVSVIQNNDQVKIKNNQSGDEYLIDLGNDEAKADNNVIDDSVEQDIKSDDMNESRVYEIALNEYDSHVGYTDNYQKKDVMTGDNVNEPGKGVRSIDKGVPTGNQKPWSKQKKSVAPFNGEKGKTVEECDEPITEAGHNVGGKVQQRSMGGTTVLPNNPAATQRPHGQHHVRVAGKYVGNPDENTEKETEVELESIKKKAEAIFEENKKLKSYLSKFKKTLEEAALTNVSLGCFARLVSENTMTQDEKSKALKRFSEDVKTIDESKRLYKQLSRELKEVKHVSVPMNEEVQLNAEGSKTINESKIYKDDSVMQSLDLMHKIC